VQCSDEAAAKVAEFFNDRLYNAAIDRGYRHDFVRAVLASGSDDVRGVWDRLDALAECAGRTWWPELVELVDRTYRIQRDAGELTPVDESLLAEPLEVELAAALRDNQEAIEELFDEGDYVGAAERYSDAFARIVHEFFEKVFVNVEDQALRTNRLALVGAIWRLYAESIADLAECAGQAKA